MKLISLNIEGKRHLDTVIPFLEKEDADVVCLMEAPEDFQNWLSGKGLQTTFTPMLYREQDGKEFTEGLIFASKESHTSEIFYYYENTTGKITKFIKDDKSSSVSHPVIFASLPNINIATTHFTWNPFGETADERQTEDLVALLGYLKDKPKHVLCGDFNIPRNINILYREITKYYIDNIPPHHPSSLDRDKHRSRNIPRLDKLFSSFMVDYLFSQGDIKVSDVRLEFGVSDHAAVIGEIK